MPKFKYLKLLREKRCPRPNAKNSQNPQTNRSATIWNFYTYQGLTVWIASPKILRILKQTGLNIKQIKREPKLSILTLIYNLNCPIHQSFVNSRVNFIFPLVCYLFNILFFLSLIYSESFFWCQVTSKTFMFSIFTNSC